MQELDDISLLKQYAEQESEEVFAALVSRHINKVYSVALRHTHNPAQAEEITQAVFVILAKRINRLGKRVILSGWLYQTARLASLTFLKSEIRRARREHEAHMQTLTDQAESDEAWKQMSPQLDGAIAGIVGHGNSRRARCRRGCRHRHGNRRHTRRLGLRPRKPARAFRRIVRPRALACWPQLQPLRRAAGRPGLPSDFSDALALVQHCLDGYDLDTAH